MDNITITIQGAMGCGKTTLQRTIAQALAEQGYCVQLQENGEPIPLDAGKKPTLSRTVTIITSNQPADEDCVKTVQAPKKQVGVIGCGRPRPNPLFTAAVITALSMQGMRR